VLPPAGILKVEGFEVIVKSAALMPDITGFEIVNVVVPKFCITKVLDEVPEGSNTFPKSVPSVVVGVVSPLTIELPKPVMLISTLLPYPCIANVYGFSLKSLLLIVTNAVLVPDALGLNVIVKVLDEPPLKVVPEGLAVIVKSLAFVPEIVGFEIVIDVVPKLAIVKVLAIVPVLRSVEPKSVWSVNEGVKSPLAIDVEFPCTSISTSVPFPLTLKL